MPLPESGQELHITGKSEETYLGRIYADKDATTTLSGKTIVCLTNSIFLDGRWSHQMNSIFTSTDVQKTMEHFKDRADISHLILIPETGVPKQEQDPVDDLIRAYLHT